MLTMLLMAGVRMANSKPLTASRVLELGTTGLMGVAVWGTLWNLIYGQAVYRTFKPCTTSFHLDFSTSTNCAAVPQVPWLLIAVCAVIGIALGIASIVAETSSDAARIAKARATQTPQTPTPQGPANQPPKHQAPTYRQPAPPPPQPLPAGAGATPAAEKKPFGFLADSRLAGLLGVVGLVLTVVQLIK
jgi:cell division septation protein DedD